MWNCDPRPCFIEAHGAHNNFNPRFEQLPGCWCLQISEVVLIPPAQSGGVRTPSIPPPLWHLPIPSQGLCCLRLGCLHRAVQEVGGWGRRGKECVVLRRMGGRRALDGRCRGGRPWSQSVRVCPGLIKKIRPTLEFNWSPRSGV